MAIMKIYLRYEDYPLHGVISECSICGYKKSFTTNFTARRAAAQHLWVSRQNHHNYKAKPPQVGKINKCPHPKKKRYATKEEAKNHIVRLYRNGQGNADYRAYLCVCKAWHVGHSQERLKQRIKSSLRK